jgi:hypothetical protein
MTNHDWCEFRPVDQEVPVAVQTAVGEAAGVSGQN